MTGYRNAVGRSMGFENIRYGRDSRWPPRIEKVGWRSWPRVDGAGCYDAIQRRVEILAPAKVDGELGSIMKAGKSSNVWHWRR